jgi:hypothetical protein
VTTYRILAGLGVVLIVVFALLSLAGIVDLLGWI